MMFSLTKRVVVLTGAASGIGAALADRLAERGGTLALIDRDGEGLRATAQRAEAKGARVSTYVVDLCDRNAIAKLPDAVMADIGAASVLINNAGMALAGSFEQAQAEQFERVMAVNFFAAVAMVRAFLPQLRQRAPAQIVNISSILGIVGSAGEVAYSSSKFALRGFSESLRAELVDADIGVTVVHPGGVRTNIIAAAMADAGLNPQQVAGARGAAEKRLRMDAATAAARIVAGLERREKRMIVGSDARIAALLAQWMPVSYSRFLPRPGASKAK